MVGSDREKRGLGEAAVAGPIRHRAEFYLTGLRDTLAQVGQGSVLCEWDLPGLAGWPCWPGHGVEATSLQPGLGEDRGRRRREGWGTAAAGVATPDAYLHSLSRCEQLLA